MREGRASRSVGWFAFHFAIPVLAILVFLPPLVMGAPIDLSMFARLILVAAVYTVAHGIRAVRLGLLAVQGLRLPFRTVFLLHFHTAPVSALFPFKLGEFYRFAELAVISNSVQKPIMLMVLERIFDALILLAICGLVAFGGDGLPKDLHFIAGVLALTAVSALIVLFVLGGSLRQLQVYIVKHHRSVSAMRLLRAVHSAREAIDTARTCMRGNLALLLLLSALLWFCECLCLVLIAPSQAADIGLYLVSALSYVLSARAPSGSVELYGLVTSITLLVLWLAAVPFFYRRILALAAWRAPEKPPRLEIFQPARIQEGG